jgi:metallo-beta-lactamase family protein
MDARSLVYPGAAHRGCVENVKAHAALSHGRRGDCTPDFKLTHYPHIATLDSYSAHADHKGLLAWLAARGPVGGSIFLDHGEQPALDRLAADAAAIPGLPRAILPLLGERFRLEPGAPAARAGKPRPDVAELVAPEDWRNRYAAFRASLDEQLRALPDDAARVRAIAAAERALRQG